MIDERTLDLAVALSKSIDNLDLCSRTWTALRRWGILTIGDLYLANKNGQLIKVRNIGKKGLYEIDHAMGNYLQEWEQKREV